MSDAAETRFTRSADGTNLAYQLSGDGPLDLVFRHIGGIPIDLMSEDPGFIRLRRRLETFSRTLWFDARGLGASDGDPRDSLNGATSDADLTAVLDAAGFDQPAIVAWDASGGRTIHFSVAHPDRVSALVVLNSYAHYVREEDEYPWGLPSERLDGFVASLKETWGTAAGVPVVAPSRVGRRALPGMVRPVDPVQRWL
jgi:pimeloyl-ACP methyl ester carboxylesterase